LLTCRYPTFVDGSNNAFTITVNGNTTVSTQNPFPLTTLPNPAQGNAGNGIFSMSQYQSLKQQNLWPTVDPYFDYTTLLLHGNGTNGGQNNTFQDSSSNNFTITRNGNTTQGTFSPFSQTGWSNYFSGSAGLATPTSTDFDGFGNGTSWQIDFWWYPIASATQWAGPFETVGGNGIFFRTRSGYLDFTNNNDNAGLIRSDYPSLNRWHHIVLVCDGSTNQRSVFIDGTRTGTVTNTAQFNNGSITLSVPGSNAANDYYSNFRVIKGSRTYDPAASSITVPTTPSTAVTGTVLLTCQSNRFLDTNTQASPKTLTPSNSPSVQAFSPFAPTAAYSASTVGGSGYFDGTGDYLQYPVITLGSSDVTAECWVYLNSLGNQEIFGINYNSDQSSYGAIRVQIASNTLRFMGTTSGSSFAFGPTSASKTPAIGEWAHIAVVRSGTTFTLYLNGTSVATATGISGSLYAGTFGGRVGSIYWSGGNDYLNGYVSNFRIVAGTAVYTGNFTPPTAPLTNITNTSLLLNFTNAAIIDNTAKNVLETVGNAQISTSVSKFGGASIYLDGNDNCVIPNSENFNFRNGNFTIEFWYYPSTLTVANAHILDFGDGLTGGQNGWNVGFFGSSNTNMLGVIWTYDGSSENKIQDSVALTTGSWVFVTVVRSGTSLVLYKNGISVASATLSGAIATSNRPLVIGSNQSLTSGYVNGYIDDLRITKGIARYTSNFTPQTSQWQDQ
jgi:hypothetical protein